MTVHRLTLTLIFTFFSLLITTISSLAAEATFSWLPNEEPITGYKIHYGTESRSYNYVIDVGLPTAIDGRVSASVDGLMEGETYYFAATAYTGAEESDYSGEVTHTVPVPDDPLPSVTSDATFSWIPNEAPVSGYKIHYGVASRNYTSIVDVGLPVVIDGRISASVDGLVEGETYYFAATAYTETEESDYSSEVIFTVLSSTETVPPVVSDISLQGNEDGPLSGQLYADSPVGTALEFTITSQPTHGTLTVEDSSGAFTYSPSPNFSGNDTFSYTATNIAGTSAPSTVTITVVPVNDWPIAANGSFSVIEDSAYSGTLTATDVDGDSLSYTLVAQAAKGSVTVNQNGSFVYTPNQDVSGSDSFTFKAGDGSSESNIATVNIVINPVNDVPVASSANVTTSEDTSYTGQLQGSDVEGDTLSYSLVSQATEGSVVVNQNGSFTYTPNQDVSGSDSFTFKAGDGSSESNIATVNVTVLAVNEAPTTSDSAFSVDQNSEYTGQLSATDGDGDMLLFSVATGPEKGAVEIASDGSFTYTPTPDSFGDDLFTFVATDGTLDSNVGTVNVVINEVSNDLAFELGELLVTSDWQHVDFSTPFNDPSVIAKSSTTNDSESTTVTIRNVTNSGFDIRLREWAYLDGIHPEEIVSFLAMERGHHEVADNVYAEADCIELSGLNSFATIPFTSSLSSDPVVLASVVTENEPDAVTLRVQGVTSQGFSVTMQEQENSDGNHIEEIVCFIAWEKWSGLTNGLMVEVSSTDNTLTDIASAISFTQQFSDTPFIMAGMQSANGMNTAILGLNELSVTDSKMTIIEEQSMDAEVSHIAEIGGYFAIVPFDPSEDSDLDGLTNEEELLINTHPGLLDTDQDTISDGEEYDYWHNLGFAIEVDTDGDGLDNLHDADSDNDGVLDGIEIAKGFDPADPASLPTLNVEIGEVTVGSAPVRVYFTEDFTSPVIIANAVTKNDTSPCVVAISNVAGDGFDIQLQEYDYQDNIHDLETVSYIVMEKGSYVLDDGSQVEAGLFSTSATTNIGISLVSEFDIKPVVLTSLNSSNDTETATGRIRNISSIGFEYKLQEQEINSNDHGMETVAYLAWTPGTGTTNGFRFQAGTTGDSVTHSNYTITFDQQFNSLPYHFADMQTTDGGDTSTLKITQAAVDSMQVMVEEEGSKDSEVRHTKEVAGFLILMQE